MRRFKNRSVLPLLAIVGVAALATSAYAALLEFQIPEKVVMEKESEFSGSFTVEPLEPGMGRHMGRLLKRVISGKMEGHAIVVMKVPGMETLDDQPEGVSETGHEIATRLSGVRLKQVLQGDNKIFVSVRGQEVVTAGDIGRHTNAFEITNPDHVIANLEDPRVQFDIELTVAFGKASLSAAQNTPDEPAPGEFGIYALFSPVTQVGFEVVRVPAEEGTGHEQLVMQVATDGTRLPEDVLKDAADAIQRIGVRPKISAWAPPRQ
jgi:DNA-directed RNA polymerase subunit alpha